jgi:hypothetical protein
MTMPTVTEVRRELEPVTRDPFIDGLPTTPSAAQPAGRRASDAHADVLRSGGGAVPRGEIPL